MKKISLVLLFLVSTANAGFYDSDYFEPTVGCIVVGAIGYSGADDSDKMMKGGLYCLGGVLLANGIKSYMRKKIDRVNQSDINETTAKINKYISKQAKDANLGAGNSSYMLEVEQIEKGQQLPDGSFISPTKRTIFVSP